MSTSAGTNRPRRDPTDQFTLALLLTKRVLGGLDGLRLGPLTEEWFAEQSTFLMGSGAAADLSTPDALRALYRECSNPQPAWIGLLKSAVARSTDPSAMRGKRERHRALRRLLVVLPHEIVVLLANGERQQVMEPLLDQSMKRFLALDFGDAHVHSGGATPVGPLLDLVLSNLAEALPVLNPGTDDRQQAPELLARDTISNKHINIYPLICGLAWVSMILDDGLNSWRQRALADGGVPGRWAADGRLWPQLADLASCSTLPTDEMHPVWDGLKSLYLRDSVPHFTRLLEILGRTLNQGVAQPFDSETEALLRGTLNAICVLHTFTTSVASSSLEVFAGRFKLLGDLRKTHRQSGGLGPSTEARRVTSTLEHLCGHQSLSRLELRKTISLKRPDQADDQYSPKGEVLSDIREHLEGIYGYLDGSRRQLAVQMPIGFLRQEFHAAPDPIGDSFARSHRFPLLEGLAVAQGIALVLNERPKLWPFIGGVDVAGLEGTIPGWVHAVTYQYLDALLDSLPMPRQPFIYSVHAGENFNSPLQGLRRTAEVLSFGVPISRVGHGLALDEHVTERSFKSSLLPTHEVLENLCWADSFIDKYSIEMLPSLNTELEDTLLEIAKLVFDARIPLSTLRSWYRRRFSMHELAKIGVGALQEPTMSYPIAWQSSIEPIIKPTHDELDDALLSAYLFTHSAAVRRGPVRRVKYNPDIDIRYYSGDIAKLYSALYDLLRPHVIAAFMTGNRGGKIIIECCPSSNISIGRYDGYSEHPLRQFTDLGLDCTVNSDDPGIFASRVHEEFIALLATGKYTSKELDKIRTTGIRNTAVGVPGNPTFDFYKDLRTEALY